MVRLHGINGSWWSHHHETLFKPRMQTRINAHSFNWIFNQNDDLNWNQAWALPSLHTTYRNPRFSDHFTMRFDNSPALDPNFVHHGLGLVSDPLFGLAELWNMTFGYFWPKRNKRFLDIIVLEHAISQWSPSSSANEELQENKAPNNPATGTTRPPSIFWSLGLFKLKPAVNVSHAQKPRFERWIIGCGYVLQ